MNRWCLTEPGEGLEYNVVTIDTGKESASKDSGLEKM